MRLRTDDKGIIALMTVVLIALLLTIITIGLTRSMINNQRQTIDEQSSNQAYYAAESGIQDAIRLIRESQKNGTAFPAKDSCDTSSNTAGSLSGDASVRYSCLLIRTDAIDSLHKVGENDPLQLDIHPTTAYKTLNIDWWLGGNGATDDGTDNNTPVSNTGSNPAGTNYPFGVPSVLRAMVSVVPGAPVSREIYRQGTKNVFMSPARTVTPLGDNILGVSGTCPQNKNLYPDPDARAYSCHMSIDLGSLDRHHLIVRLRALYKPTTSVRISLSNDKGVLIKPEIQAIIDSTGKVGDIVKRLQVRYALSQRFTDGIPGYSIESSYGICKDVLFSNDLTTKALTVTDQSNASNGCPTLP